MEHRTSARPRVLLADDHAAFLDWVSRFLGGVCDIVGLASDGRQAVDLARRLRPDLAVLDVAMPQLDGFQTLEHLRRDGVKTKVVFLTMHDDDEFVAAAINAGAHAYVLKSRIYVDLISAIDHALAGRLFVPSLTSLSTIPGSRHAIHFHTHDHHFLDDVGQLLSTVLRSGEAVALIANEATRVALAQRLRARQMNLAMLAERGQYVEHDSDVALSHVMHDGRLDGERLAQVADSLDRFRAAAPNGPQGRLTIFGDLTIALCRKGDLTAAVELERTWNVSTRAMPFFTICSYPIDCFDRPEAANQLANVCAEHTAVTSGMSRNTRDIG